MERSTRGLLQSCLGMIFFLIISASLCVGQTKAPAPTFKFVSLWLSAEKQVGCFEREVLRIEVGAVGEHDDR